MSVAFVACGAPSSDEDNGTTGTTTSEAAAEVSGDTTGSTAESGSTLASSDGSSSTGPDEPVPPGDIVVDAAWLKTYLLHDDVQIVDTRADPGIEHIPGAIAIDPLAIATNVDGVDLQLMPAAEAQAVLAAAGLRNGTTAVVYGAPPQYDPARVVWALHSYGHGDVRYLDGGFAAWREADGAIEMGAIVPERSQYELGAPDDAARVDSGFVLNGLGEPPYDAPMIGLVDARSPEEWDAGRIPTAAHVQWTRTLDVEGRLLPPAELQTLYAGVSPTQTIVVYCLVGWRASVAWLSLRHAGFADVRVYDGSWIEWGSGDFPTEP